MASRPSVVIQSIARRIVAEACGEAGRRYWPSFYLSKGRRVDLVNLPLSIYNGKSGILYALAKYAVHTNDAQCLDFVRIETPSILEPVGPRENLSFYTGALGRAFVGLFLSRSLNDQSLYEAALKLSENAIGIDPRGRDGGLDLLSGAAGEIFGLLMVRRYADIEISPALLSRCLQIERMATPVPAGVAWFDAPRPMPLSGLSHGAAGIALSLLQAAEFQQSERFAVTAFDALEYEQWLFQHHAGYWPDYRLPAIEKGLPVGDPLVATETLPRNPNRIDAWCHGSLGMAVARLGCKLVAKRYEPRPECVDVTAAMQAYAKGFSHRKQYLNVSLCHGLAGCTAVGAYMNEHGEHTLGRGIQEEALGLAVASLLTDGPCEMEADCSLFTGYSGVLLAALSLHRPSLVADVVLPVARMEVNAA